MAAEPLGLGGGFLLRIDVLVLRPASVIRCKMRGGSVETWSRQQPRDHATRTPGHGTRFCVIHPGSGSRDKCWPMERFFELARRLRNQHEVLWIVGPTELDWWDQDVIDPIGKEFPLLRCPRLEVLAGVLARCSVFIGNDSGPSHLAAAIGAKTIALFGPTDPRHFAPRGRQVKILSAERLEMISVEQVLSAVSVAWASRP